MLIQFMLHNKSDLNSINILSNLNKFTYTKQNKKSLQKQPNVFEINKKVETIDNVIDEKLNNNYRPKQINSLFWCVFIAAHGYNEYMKVNHNYGAKELEIKQKISSALHKNKHMLKDTNYKLSQVKIKEIISDFLTTVKDTNMNCLIALTVYFEINLLIIHPNNKFMIKIGNHTTNEFPSYLLFKDTYNKYSIQLDSLSNNDIEQLYEKYLYIDNFLRPIKSASNYKVDELINTAKKVNIYDEQKKYKKQELYDLVFNFVKWF
jgi:hypothetical protein